MSSWEMIRLGDLVSIKHGWPFKTEFISEDLTGRPIVVNIGNFRYTGGFRFDDTKVREYRGDYPPEYNLCAGDILLVMTCQTSEGEILGIPARVPDDGRTYLHNQRLGKVIVIHPEKVRSDFLYCLFLYPEFNRWLFTSSSGTKILHTAPKRIESFEFNLPPLNEQREIAKILWDLDSKIELNQQMNKTLEAIGHAIFKHWFINFEFPNEEGKPYKSSGGEMVDSDLEKIPKEWKYGKYSDLVEITTGKGLKREEFVENGKFPVMGANGELGRTDNFLFDENLILTGRVGTLGTVYVVRDKVWISDNVLISKAKSNEFFYYSYYTLRNFEFESLNRGSTQPLITQTDLKNQTCLIPNHTILVLFNKILSSVLNKIYDNNFQNKNLSQIRNLLLPKLMSGKIRVPVEA
ncbi:MAG: restriction endonuclease subunit S [Thaumarchaeota archaeon]|nr:restriction endonuclease subunit S [Nitrososphaerota archaeon]